MKRARRSSSAARPCITYDEQYGKFKPQVEALVRAQERLCNRFLSEAEDLIKKLRPDDGSNPRESARRWNGKSACCCSASSCGQPKSEGLLKLLEEPENLRLMNQAELQLHADQKKIELYAEKEELFFAIDEKSHEADLTEKGRNFLSPKDPDAFMLPDLTTALHDIDTGPEPDPRKRLEAKTKLQQEFETKAQQIHAISQLLKAYCLYQKDVQYVVQDNKVIIVDENTGPPDDRPPLERWPAPGRRGQGRRRDRARDPDARHHHHSELLPPLPQAGRHDRHGGNRSLRVLRHLQAGRAGHPDQQAGGAQGRATTRSTRPGARSSTPCSTRSRTIHGQGRPILVGTISVEVSEHLSRMLKREGIIHSVLNAKYHQQEAEIVTRAGQRGAVTIATNMAGRGTDIKLGPGVADAGRPARHRHRTARGAPH